VLVQYDLLSICAADGDVRNVRDVGAPIESMLLIQIENFGADLIGERAVAARTAAFDRESDVVLAEDVGEVRADAAADAESVTIRADADRRRSDIRDMQRVVVAAMTEDGALRRKSLLGMLKIRGYL